MHSVKEDEMYICTLRTLVLAILAIAETGHLVQLLTHVK